MYPSNRVTRYRVIAMQTRDVEYSDSTGKRYVGFLAAPPRPTGPAVLVAHNAPGVSDFERGVARRLAQAGYVALCADYIGDGEVLSMQAIGTRIGPLIADTTLVREPINAALAALVRQSAVDSGRIAAIGYCFGGAAVLELARTGAAVKAVVGFHSSLPVTRPQDNKNIQGKVLLQQGASDPLVPPDVRATFEVQMNEAAVDWRMILYGGTLHAFTVPGSENIGMAGVAYDKASDERSWRAMLDLFEESIG
jgi:dienelactone hydrolase